MVKLELLLLCMRLTCFYLVDIILEDINSFLSFVVIPSLVAAFTSLTVRVRVSRMIVEISTQFDRLNDSSLTQMLQLVTRWSSFLLNLRRESKMQMLVLF
jgi:hypothetical protein